MRIVVWLLLYIAAVIVETALLPGLAGSYWVHSLSTTLLIVGIASQSFSDGFWLASLAGFIFDALLAAPAAISAIAFAMAVFAVISTFKALVELDEPLYSIASVVIGFAALPLAWFLAISASKLLDTRIEAATRVLMPMRFMANEAVFALVFVMIYAWVSIHRFSKKRVQELSSL